MSASVKYDVKVEVTAQTWNTVRQATEEWIYRQVEDGFKRRVIREVMYHMVNPIWQELQTKYRER